MQRTMTTLALIGFAWIALGECCRGQETQSLILRIKAVGKEGAGNVEASKAFKQLVALGPDVMPDVLAGMNDANPIALNWLRAAVESIQDRAVNNGKTIPAAKIEAFLNDTRHSGPARRLAFECLAKDDRKAPDRLLPKMLDDPSAEIRRDAVAAELARVKLHAAVDTQMKLYQKLLTHARDRDQINTITEHLKNDHGIDIDLINHFGFVTRWLLVGPFDNAKGVGFSAVYAPEKSVDIQATYAGKNDQKVKWREYTAGMPKKKKIANEDLAVVDFNEAVGKLKGTVCYAYAAVTSETERPVEIRVGSNNAVRFYLNGKDVYFREEYHHGFEMDQHVGKGTLKAGRNEILVKVCQNEQTDSWAELWSFQLRICDHLGAAVPVVNVTGKVN